MDVAILILLELTLQYHQGLLNGCEIPSRNPYFIGINSAMTLKKSISTLHLKVAILILLELTLQCDYYDFKRLGVNVAILILLELTLQYIKGG